MYIEIDKVELQNTIVKRQVGPVYNSDIHTRKFRSAFRPFGASPIIIITDTLQTIHPPNPPINQSTNPSTNPPTHPSTHPPIIPSTRPQSIYTSFHPPTHPPINHPHMTINY
ncbi:hypothetical protein DPMN_031652 [Dreissena polymorpha]|uniref:Uncharacterized protein n=1 Tax=Dreissena polymorpha TaxID=45954 RepID=A0A9D4RJB2_DREPO|nr:hypothetical protein DPMN_031652 [Dreissena polymorpha]